MTDLNKLCNVVAKELREDRELVRNIAMYQFKFTIDVMKDEEDTHDILFNKLFKFKLKRRFKENKKQKYSSK